MNRIARLGLALMATTMISGTALADDVTIGIRTEPSSMDPYFHNLGPNNAMLGQIFGRLVEWPPAMDKIIPRLATSWKAIDDTTWEFKLREGVKFHDGTAFTADDVLFSFARADGYTGGNSSFRTYTKGKTVTKVDDFTIHIKTEAPYPLMPNDMTTLMIMSSEAKGTGGEANNGIKAKDFNDGLATMGTGPYKFVEWKKGDQIVVEKYDGYAGPMAQPWDKITFKVIKSDPARTAALLAGDVDMIDDVATPDIPALKTNDAVALSQGVSNRVIYIHIDQFRDVSPFVTDKAGNALTKNPLKDARVRKALSKMIDRDEIVEKVMEGVAIKAGQLLPEGFFGRSPNLKPDAYDPEGAKALLAEAGWADGFALTIHGPNNRYINDGKIAEAIAQMLTRNGIPTKVETMPSSVYFKRASSGGPDKTPEFSFFLVGWGAGSGEPSSPLKSLLATVDASKGQGASNRGQHSDPELDAVLVEALATVDDDKRAALLAKATDIGIGRNMGIIPLHYQVNTWATRKGLKYEARADERTVGINLIKDN